MRMKIQSCNNLQRQDRVKPSSQPHKSLLRSMANFDCTKTNPVNFKAILFQNGLNISEKAEIENLIENYKENNEKIELLGQGSFGVVYKINLKNRGNVAVKILKQDKEKLLTGGGNLKNEAEILRKIPASCKRSQQLIDYFETPKRNYLVSSFVKGQMLSKQKNLSQELLDNITDELFKYDKYGLMFYDPNPDNIFIYNDQPGFIDFEFMEKKNPNCKNFQAYNDYHHISRNLYFPQKSNINAFENRTLGKYIKNIEKNEGKAQALLLTERYLKSLSKYHAKMADYLDRRNKNIFNDITNKAIEYEKALSEIYKKPSKEIIEIEKDLIDIRYTTLNYHLFVHRNNENKLLKDDIENYGNFDNYINKINKKTKKILKMLDDLSTKNQNKDIQNYCKTNKLYIQNFLRKNANKNFYKFRKNPDVNKNLENMSKNIIGNYKKLKLDKTLNSEIKKFNIEYTNIKNKNKENKNIQEFCDAIKFTLYNTLQFIKEEQI